MFNVGLRYKRQYKCI